MGEFFLREPLSFHEERKGFSRSPERKAGAVFPVPPRGGRDGTEGQGRNAAETCVWAAFFKSRRSFSCSAPRRAGRNGGAARECGGDARGAAFFKSGRSFFLFRPAEGGAERRDRTGMRRRRVHGAAFFKSRRSFFPVPPREEQSGMNLMRGNAGVQQKKACRRSFQTAARCVLFLFQRGARGFCAEPSGLFRARRTCGRGGLRFG